MDDPRVLGILIQRERKILTDLVGTYAMSGALAELPRAVRTEYDEVGPLTRIRTATVERVYQQVADHTHQDVFAMHRTLVQRGLENMLTGVWRMMIRATSDDALVRRTPLFFSRTLSQLSSRMVQPGLAEVRLTGWARVSKLQVNGLSAGIETVLRRAGRKEVRVDAHHTTDGACFTARWTV